MYRIEIRSERRRCRLLPWSITAVARGAETAPFDIRVDKISPYSLP